MRNKLSIVTLLLCAGTFSYAQNYNPIEIPCKKVNTVTFFQFNGVVESTCIEDLPSIPLPIIIAGSQNVELKASEEINLDNEVWINPNPNGEFYAHIEPSDIGIAWYEPLQNPGIVPLYEKLEIGIDLPLNVKNKINNFVNNTGIHKLNPFNPKQVNVKAEFWRNSNPNGNGTWLGPLKVYGFYYEEFIENTNGTPVNWTLDNIATEHKFRIRFAPPQTGIWRCKITAIINENTPQETVLTASEFTFGCVTSNNPGYVKVGTNNHFFTLGGQTYFPSGRNIPQPDLTSNNTQANQLYDIVSVESNNGYDNRKINPAFHKTFRDDLTTYKNSGGNYFRTLFYGDWYEIEFEKLNNYYDRLNTAWEFDRFINHCEDLDLKLDFCLSNYEYGQILGDFTQKWDWASPIQLIADPNNDYDCVSDPTNTNGYCYNTELGIASPEAFLTNLTAIELYQYRLRYIVSRWGYSTSIAIMMLQAEMNNHAKFQNFQPLPDCNHDNNQSFAYNENQNNYLENVSFWQEEMCKFLKTDQYFPHLTSVNYTGCPREIWDQQSSSNVNAIQNGDNSYYSAYVDVATYDHYQDFWSKNKAMFTNTTDLLDHRDIFTNLAPAINKPMMVAETGDSDAQLCDQGISYIKDTWTSAFMGLAGSALNWEYQHQYNLVQHNSNLSDFFNGINLNNVDWLPGRDERNDYKAAVYYLKSNEIKQRAIGIIDNQTANQYTLGSNNCGYQITDIEDENYRFDLSSTIDPAGFFQPWNKLSIDNMGIVKRYTIDYYNATTGAHIHTDNSKYSQLDGDLILDFPQLSLGFAGNGFLMAFKVRRYNEPSFYTPVDSVYIFEDNLFSDSESSSESITPLTLTDWEEINTKDSIEMEINPNPTSGLVKVIIKNQLYEKAKIILMDSKGSLIETKDLSGELVIFDLTSLEKGIYFIILESNDIRVQKKVVKL